MTDENTPDSPDAGVPDATPTEPMNAVEPAATVPPAAGGSNTRTILEIVGGVVAVGLIIMAGAGGFAVGLAVGDGHGHDDDHWSDHFGDGGMGRGYGDGGMGRGYGDGDGFGMDGFGMGPGQNLDGDQLRQQMEDMLERFMDEFGEGAGPGMGGDNS